MFSEKKIISAVRMFTMYLFGIWDSNYIRMKEHLLKEYLTH